MWVGLVVARRNSRKRKQCSARSRGECRSFLGGSVVKNLPANAGDTGLIPSPG